MNKKNIEKDKIKKRASGFWTAFVILAIVVVKVTGYIPPQIFYIDYIYLLFFSSDPTQSLIGYPIGVVSSWIYIMYNYVAGWLFAYKNDPKKTLKK